MVESRAGLSIANDIFLIVLTIKFSGLKTSLFYSQRG